jgi:predicted nucleotidyltransferase
MLDLGFFSATARGHIDRAIQAAERDPRIVGLTLGGSAVAGGIDEFSDLDFVVVCRDEDQPALLAEARQFAQRLGPLLASFTGEHVGEPRLLICLYGPPLIHVDLKFVALHDLEHRVEDGIVVWERDSGMINRAAAGTVAVWPQPDLQWIEDRFWIWVHYAASRIGRGELFECLEACAYFRNVVFGPLLAVAHGQRPQGVRRLEWYAGDALPELEGTIGDHTREGCLRALQNSIRLYRRLRDEMEEGSLARRTEAEAASLDYLHATATEA